MSDPTDANFPEGPLLMPGQVDQLGRALISLTREVCVITDRMLVLEQLLQDNGIDVVEAVDTHQPNEALQARIDETTKKIVGSVMNELAGIS